MEAAGQSPALYGATDAARTLGNPTRKGEKMDDGMVVGTGCTVNLVCRIVGVAVLNEMEAPQWLTG